MQKIELICCGVDTAHTKDQYYIRGKNRDAYLLSFFKTPFVYKEDGQLLAEEAYRYLINPPFTPAEHGSYREGFVNDWIFFKGEGAEEIIRAFDLPLGSPFYMGKVGAIAPFLQRILQEQGAKQPMYEAKISGIIADMLITLGRLYSQTKQESHPAFSAINEARNYMLTHYREKISIRELAERANYSESRFSTLYSRFFGNSPIEDLLTLRIEKAISLLSYEQRSVTETAKLCGFSSVHYFSRKFKERTGTQPGSFLKKQK